MKINGKLYRAQIIRGERARPSGRPVVTGHLKFVLLIYGLIVLAINEQARGQTLAVTVPFAYRSTLYFYGGK